MRWELAPTDPVSARLLSQRLGISVPIAELLCKRGWEDPVAAETFLKPHLRRLADPLAVHRLPEAVERVRVAMQKEESILVFGDYDVDGVTSTAMLVSILQRFGLTPRYTVPKRQEEGYGLSHAALERALEAGKPDLLIAVDCGTSSCDEVAWLASQGIDVIILDHHQAKADLPAPAILVNPHVHDPETAPWRDLCAVGLVFKFVHGLLKVLRAAGDHLARDIDLKEYLDLAALGTIADLVPLHGENRILAKNGLRALRSTRRIGLQALYEVSKLTLGEPIAPFDISFRLGPRINASGRLDDAHAPIEMLLGSDFTECRQIARTLDGFNSERQQIEGDISQAAVAGVEHAYLDDPGLVMADAGWHTGVVGIVASRLVQRFHRPSLVLGIDEDGLARGSGRSIRGIDLVQVLGQCNAFLDKWGGHPMAVGVSLQADQIDAFRDAFNAAILDHTRGVPLERILEIDLEVSPADLTDRLLEELEQIAPFGQAHPEPILMLRQVSLPRLEPFGVNHLRFQLDRPGGGAVSGIAWKGAENPPPVATPIDLAVRFSWNHWNGRRSPRLTLVDWRV